MNKTKWNERYELACLYYKYNGNLDIPRTFKTKNGYTYDCDGYALGDWLKTQKRFYQRGNFNREKIKKLESIKIRWDYHAEKWDEMYALANLYYEKHGDLRIKQDFKTKNGYEYDKDGYKLGIWLRTQKTRYNENCLDTELVEKLESIGVEWNHRTENWDKMYALASTYYEYNGNLKIKRYFKTRNGYEYNEDGYNLGTWITTQRVNYKNKKLSAKRIEKLENIRMLWDSQKNTELRKDENIININNENEDKWNKMYALASSYYEHNGNLAIPIDFKTKNGYEYDENGYNLGIWISNQRQEKKGHVHNKITPEQIAKLKAIGMVWEIQDSIEFKSNKEINSIKKEIKSRPKDLQDKINELEEEYLFKKSEIPMESLFNEENIKINMENFIKILNRDNIEHKKGNVIYHEGKTLREFCIINRLNYDVIYNTIKRYNMSIENAIEYYKKHGQENPRFYVYELEVDEKLLKHVLLNKGIDSSKVIHLLKEYNIDMYEAILKCIFDKYEVDDKDLMFALTHKFSKEVNKMFTENGNDLIMNIYNDLMNEYEIEDKNVILKIIREYLKVKKELFVENNVKKEIDKTSSNIDELKANKKM